MKQSAWDIGRDQYQSPLSYQNSKLGLILIFFANSMYNRAIISPLPIVQTITSYFLLLVYCIH